LFNPDSEGTQNAAVKKIRVGLNLESIFWINYGRYKIKCQNERYRLIAAAKCGVKF
jgi:hypothetical protein